MKVNKILIIVQRSNGDVFLSLPLIEKLYNYYDAPQIDMIVNDDTLGIAKTLQNIHNIFTFSYSKKRETPLLQEWKIIKKIYKKYDLSINLTESDRSVLYSILAGKFSISAVEKDKKKSNWKRFFLDDYYIFDREKHIVLNNCESLNILGIQNQNIKVESYINQITLSKVRDLLEEKNIDDFIIFHTSAQYNYKVYPTHLRNKLIQLLSENGINVIITGGNTEIDQNISNELPVIDNVYNFIGKTSLSELLSLISLSKGYIGMDTLVMHMSASLNKHIFAIFGPSRPVMWGPWKNKPDQIIKVFQAKMNCVPCGLAGCDDKHGKSDCLYNIYPEDIFKEVKKVL